MERLRGGLFGCGMISEFHLRGWQRIPEVEIVALGNRTISRAEARRDQYVPGARVYADLAVMLWEERLDFVDILSVPWMHCAHCLLAREAGVHVICQKPLCNSLEEARLLVREMAESPRLFAVHENHRYRPWFRKVLALHREGVFGAPLFLRLEQHDPHEPPERYKLEAEHGVLLEYGTHLVDMMVALLRGPSGSMPHFNTSTPRCGARATPSPCTNMPGPPLRSISRGKRTGRLTAASSCRVRTGLPTTRGRWPAGLPRGFVSCGPERS